MKNYLLLFFVCSFAMAQEKKPARTIELRTNVLTTISQGNYNLSIEKKTTGNLSYGVSASTTQSKKLSYDFEIGNKSTLAVWDVTPFVRLKLSKSLRSYYFAETFTSLNHGRFKSIVRSTDSFGNAVYVIEKQNYTDIALGGSLGYKLELKSNLTLEFLVGFGSNLVNSKQSPDVVSRVGINLGYQF